MASQRTNVYTTVKNNRRTFSMRFANGMSVAGYWSKIYWDGQEFISYTQVTPDQPRGDWLEFNRPRLEDLRR